MDGFMLDKFLHRGHLPCHLYNLSPSGTESFQLSEGTRLGGSGVPSILHIDYSLALFLHRYQNYTVLPLEIRLTKSTGYPASNDHNIICDTQSFHSLLSRTNHTSLQDHPLVDRIAYGSVDHMPWPGANWKNPMTIQVFIWQLADLGRPYQDVYVQIPLTFTTSSPIRSCTSMQSLADLRADHSLSCTGERLIW